MIEISSTTVNQSQRETLTLMPDLNACGGVNDTTHGNIVTLRSRRCTCSVAYAVAASRPMLRSMATTMDWNDERHRFVDCRCCYWECKICLQAPTGYRHLLYTLRKRWDDEFRELRQDHKPKFRFHSNIFRTRGAMAAMRRRPLLTPKQFRYSWGSMSRSHALRKIIFSLLAWILNASIQYTLLLRSCKQVSKRMEVFLFRLNIVSRKKFAN